MAAPLSVTVEQLQSRFELTAAGFAVVILSVDYVIWITADPTPTSG